MSRTPSLPGFRPSRSVTGTRSKRSGESAEEHVDGLHRTRPFCERWALFRRYTQRVGDAYVGVQGPDFSGWHRSSARHVEVEVKRVPSGALAFQRIHKRDKDHPTYDSPQLRVLRDCARDGGIAVVLVLHGSDLYTATWCAVPWSVLEARVMAHAAHTTRLLLTPENLRERMAGTVTASASADELLRYAVPKDRYLDTFVPVISVPIR